MKTKNLMTAFALSAMFAACTQDAELNEAIVKNDFSNIPMVEAEFTANVGAESRMATKFGWEVGDKIGFAWLGGSTTGITVDGKAYQNHPLFCTNAENAAFKTETMLYVGQYYAYMPYTAGNMNVEAVNFNVNAQTLTTNSNDLAKSAIYISPALTSLQKPNSDGTVSSGNQKAGMGNNLALNIARVSNAATINLNLVNIAGLTDLKVTGVSLNAKASGSSVLPKSFTYAPSASVSQTSWANVATTDFYGVTNQVLGAIAATNANGIDVPADGKLTVYMLTMPVTAAPDAFEVVISTNYGDVTVDDSDVYGEDNDLCITFKDGTTDKEYTNTAMLHKLGSASTMDVYVDMDEIKVKDAIVTSQTALMNKLDMIVTADYDGPVTITLNPNNANKKGNYVFTDFTLPTNLKSKITINAGANVPNGFVFEGNTVINKEIVLNVNSTVKGKMTVNSVYRNYAYQTVLDGTGVITVAKGQELVNEGTIASEIITEAGTSANSWVNARYTSNGTNAKATGTFTNNGEIKWIAGTLPSATGLIFAEVTDFASLNKAEVAGVTTARFVNDVVFGNGGRDVTIGTNLKKIEIYSDVVMNVTKDDITGDSKTIEFAGLVGGDTTTPELEIKTGGALTIISDLKTNILKFGTSAYVYTNRNSSLNISKITVTNLGTLKYNGSVVTTNVSLGSASLVADTYGQYTNSK